MEGTTIRELRDFLNEIDEKYLDKPFVIQQEESGCKLNYMDYASEDLYYDSEMPENGCSSLEDWKIIESEPIDLRIGIRKGTPMFAEEF